MTVHPPSPHPSPLPFASPALALADIYPLQALGSEATRWNELLSRFRHVHGRLPDFVARSPGRVNIIGEHIDYSLYSVLPMEIAADALLAVAAAPLAAPLAPLAAALAALAADAAAFTVRLANLDDARFPARDITVPLEADFDIDASQFEWTNYFKSGLRGVLALLRRKRGPDWRPCHLDVVMHGNVPVGGGLSSSAAFVSASALAVLAANGETPVDKRELTELAIVSEHAVGVNSGG